ncbi:3-hydroxyacyl-CoA dehydrogenase family protein [Nonomuraea sp. PA05]|uniref:3-hydroxyacyl-CoA dehydrogenase family protein n=1 Tax=Nonomuraea sp. PA05 TaxID=2604466 RepID=UPI001CA3731C|nr:3-hydroxyacyl-CoA dehydrogenase family protein [Nonomuraea sp. PA05]
MSVGVVGAGQIGRTVAHAFAEHGPVVLMDRDPDALGQAMAAIRRAHLARLLRKATTVPGDVLTGRITTTGDLHRAATADLVVENVTEDAELKLAVHRGLAAAPPGTVIAANTSVIPISFLAKAHEDAGRLLGLHFMIPATEIRTVELITGPATAQATAERATRILDEAGFAAVAVGDGPGFVANRVLMPMVNDAAALVRTGVAAPADVDAVFTACNGHRLGPLATADLIGLDTVVHSLRMLVRFTGEERFQPDPLLLRLVGEGRSGRKAGRGFFSYGTGAA